MKGVVPIANAEEYGKIILLSRNTYDTRKAEGEIDSDTIYFVLENSTHSENYLSLYVGLARQTDIVSLNQLIGFDNVEDSVDLTEFFDENDIPIKDLLTPDKIYYWQDFDLNVFKAYIRSSITGETLPLYGTPVWQTIESE